jgi:hypothetical protein
MTDNPAKRRGRLQLLAIVAIALASVAGAYLLFQFARSGGLWGTTNKGAFVQPPVTVAELQVHDAAGRPPEAGVWWLWVVPSAGCDRPCRDALERLRQVHALLNRDAARVRRGLVNAGPAAAALADEFPRLTLLSGNLAGLAPGVYVVDPLGNLVFRYPLSDAGDPVLDDLKQLLKVSQIG